MSNPTFPTRSLDNNQPTTILFANLSPFTAQLWWLDLNGNLQLVASLARGQMHLQDTFVNHAWVVKEEHSGTVLAQVVGTENAQTQPIDTAQWKSPLTHGPEVVVQFKNSTPFAVDLFVVGNDYPETKYATLQPGTYFVRATYAQLFWRVRTSAEHIRLTEFIPNSESNQVFEIQNTVIAFDNHTMLTCDVFQIGPDDQEIKVRTLVQKESVLAENLSGWRWVVRDSYSGYELNRIDGMTVPFTVKIRDKYVTSGDPIVAVNVSFTNSNIFPVDLYLINQEGELEHQKSLANSEYYIVSAYAGYAWKIVEQYTQKTVAFFIANSDTEQSFTIRLRSIKSDQPTSVEFDNDTHLLLDVWELDSRGIYTERGQLPQGGTATYNTFVSHAWMIREVWSNTVLAIRIASREPDVIRLTDKHLHSWGIASPTTVKFNNQTSFPVEVYWYDWLEKSHIYKTLAPGQSHDQPTYTNHAWRFFKKDTGEKVGALIVYGNHDCNINIASSQTNIPTQIDFFNNSQLTVGLYWVDYEGKEVFETKLTPFDHLVQQTNAGHYWVVKDDHSQQTIAVEMGKRMPRPFHISTTHIYSLSDDLPVTATFNNQTTVKVDAYTVDSTGQEQLVASIEPGQSLGQSTFATHVWRFLAQGFDTPVGFFIANSEPAQTYTIQNNLVQMIEAPDELPDHQSQLAPAKPYLANAGFISPMASVPQGNQFDPPISTNIQPLGGKLLQGQVALYAQENYQGACWIIHSTLSNIQLVQGLTGPIASIRLGPNTGVTLFEQAGFGGQKLDVFLDTPNLQQTAIGNKIPSSIRLWHLVAPESKGVSCRSALIKDYQLNESKQMATSPTYRTILSLPKWVKEVEIWATEQVDIYVAGQKYTIDSQKSAILKPNGLAKIMINIPATQLSVPTLKIRTNTMEVDDRFLVFPDSALHARLSTLEDGAFYAARDTLNLEKAFDKAACDQVQRSIQNMARTIKYTYHAKPFGVHHNTQVTAANMEHAHWSLDFDGASPVYQPLSATDVRALIAHATPPDEAMALGFWDELTSFASSVKSIVVNTAVKVVKDVGATGQQVFYDVVDTASNVGKHVVKTVNDVGEDLVHGDVSHAWTDLRNGTLSVSRDISTGVLNVGGDLVNGGINVFGDVAQGAANLVMVTVKFADKALQYVLANTGEVGKFIGKILEKIGATVDTFIHWVMTELGWDEILHTHDVIGQTVKKNLNDLKKWPDQLKNQANRKFTGLETTVSSIIDQTIKNMGTPAMIKQPEQESYFSEAMEKVEWLLTKLFEHEANNSLIVQYPAMLAAQNSEFENFYNIAQGALGENNAQVDAVLKDAHKYLLAAFSHPSATPELALSSILEIVKVAAGSSLKIINVIFDALLDVLASSIDSFMTLINQPWDVPFLSDFYKHITGDAELTLLNFISLVVAIPATLICKAAQGVAPFKDVSPMALSLAKPSDAFIAWGYTYGAAHLAMSVVATASDTLQILATKDKQGNSDSTQKYQSSGNWVGIAGVVLGAIAQVSSVPFEWSNYQHTPEIRPQEHEVKAPSSWSNVIWFYQWGMWGLGAATVGLGFVPTKPDSKREKVVTTSTDVLKGATTLFGVVHFVMMFSLDASDQRKAQRIKETFEQYKLNFEHGAIKWDDQAKNALIQLSPEPLTKGKLDSTTSEETKQYQQQLAEYLNYQSWVEGQGPSKKLYTNLMTTMPEIGQIASASFAMKASPYLALVTLMFDLIGNFSEGIVYMLRTSEYALL